jgi:hypothetical protein
MSNIDMELLLVYSESGGVDVVSSMVKDRVLKVACGR